MKAIRADRVFDGQRLLPDGSTVLVDRGRIVEILDKEAPVPDGCEVAEFPTSTLLPGLIDAHVHLCADSGPGALDRIPEFTDDEMTAVIESSLRAQLAAGVTAVRDLGDRRWAVIEWRDQHADRALPTVVGSGPPITIPGGHCGNMGGEAHGFTQLRAAVRERAERGADLVKIMASGGVNTPGSDVTQPQFTVEELAVVVSEAHDVGLPVTAHAHAVRSIRDALTAEVDGIEHCTFIGETGIEVDQSIVATLVHTGVPVCPTLGYVPDAQFPPRLLEVMRKTGLDPRSRAETVADLCRSGVRIVAGSDAGINPGKRHGVLGESLIHLVDAGISAAEVLASATSDGAAACGLAARKGRLAPGLDADLLVLDGNPFHDITALRSVEAVYLSGERVF